MTRTLSVFDLGGSDYNINVVVFISNPVGYGVLVVCWFVFPKRFVG
ncbi:MAG: hypothetical protein PHG42_02080 [Bacteroides sp.]|nr:hypothetical protein [Bacteroides sp.]MDD4054569.1 hypothetical protein [Bacteroides sp.]